LTGPATTELVRYSHLLGPSEDPPGEKEEEEEEEEEEGAPFHLHITTLPTLVPPASMPDGDKVRG